MDPDKIKRTYYLNQGTVQNLNQFVVSYCADANTGSTYGAHSSVVDNAINFYTEHVAESAAKKITIKLNSEGLP